MPATNIAAELNRCLREGHLAELLAEGDDGAQFFKKKFVEESGGNCSAFAARWWRHYCEFGFRIEPQDAEVAGPTFCSKRKAEWTFVPKTLCAAAKIPSRCPSFRKHWWVIRFL